MNAVAIHAKTAQLATICLTNTHAHVLQDIKEQIVKQVRTDYFQCIDLVNKKYNIHYIHIYG